MSLQNYRSQCPSIAAERYFADEESANEAACFGTAQEAGFSIEQAENCDDGDVGCPNCPWKETA
jgi:hypothetical protein